MLTTSYKLAATTNSAAAQTQNLYQSWNRALADYLIKSSAYGEECYLVTTPATIAAAWADSSGETLSAQQATDSFSAAVAATYNNEVIKCKGDLSQLRWREMGDSLPRSVAFLALSVLAAYKMHTDEERSATAYYPRLVELLQCKSQNSNSKPLGFDTEQYCELWTIVKDWLWQRHRRKLIIPHTESTARSIILIPITHAPLRQIDLERLTKFFSTAGYKPGDRIARDQLAYDLERCNLLTPTGQEAFATKRQAVLTQVIQEMESWDGEEKELDTGQRSSVVYINLDIERRPRLSYVARRPAGFPDVLVSNEGDYRFESGYEGWYEPLTIEEGEGQKLRKGFTWHDTRNSKLTLRWPGAEIIVFGPSNHDAGFDSQYGLHYEENSAVLCYFTKADEVRDYLRSITRQPFKEVVKGIPDGWTLFKDIRPARWLQPPAGLEMLAVNSEVNVTVQGGLRIGRRNIWLMGAAPQVLISGLDGDSQPNVSINAQPVALGIDNRVNPALFAKPGHYDIQAGSTLLKVQIVEPGIGPSRATLGGEVDRAGYYSVPLPTGTWTLLGANPCEACTHNIAAQQGGVVGAPFRSVWAVQAEGEGKIKVIALMDKPLPAAETDHWSAPLANRAACTLWASTIGRAFSVGFDLLGLSPTWYGSGIGTIWQGYQWPAQWVAALMEEQN